MDWSKEMSGLSLRVMMVRAGSSYTSVLKASRSPRLSQPSSNASRRSALEAAGMVGLRAAAAPALRVDQAAGRRLDQLAILAVCRCSSGTVRSVIVLEPHPSGR